MTLEEVTRIVEQMKISLDSIKRVYTNKTEWKQLDLVRGDELNTLSDEIESLTEQINTLSSPTIDLSKYASSLNVKQLDTIRKSQIDNLIIDIGLLKNQFDNFSITDDIDFNKYVTKTAWKQLDLARNSAILELTKLVNDLDYIANVSGDDSWVQFNENDLFGSHYTFTFDRAHHTLKVENIVKTSNGIITRDIDGAIVSIQRGDLTKTINRDVDGNITSISDEIQTVTFSRNEYGISGWVVS